MVSGDRGLTLLHLEPLFSRHLSILDNGQFQVHQMGNGVDGKYMSAILVPHECHMSAILVTHKGEARVHYLSIA